VWTRDVTAVVAAPPRVVWGLLEQPAEWPRWDSSITEVVTKSGPLQPGKRVRLLTRNGAGVRLRVLVFDGGTDGDGAQYADAQSIPLGRVVVRRLLAADGAGTRVTFRLEIRGPFGGPWGRLVGKRLANGLRDALTGLERVATADAA
jgi:hypothetical protein